MDFSDKYVNRLNRKGSNLNEALISKSKRMFNDKFNTSPSYSMIKVNGIDGDAIVENGKKYDEKSIGFRPDLTVDIGSLVEYKNSTYLIDSIFDNGISPTGHMILCNSTYPIKQNKTRVLKTDAQGKPVLDKFGDPVYIYTEGQTISIPCIVESSIIAADENKQLPLPQGQLRVTMQYRDDIKVNDTFNMYNNTYIIRNIDYTKVINNKGIMVLSVEQVTSEVK